MPLDTDSPQIPAPVLPETQASQNESPSPPQESSEFPAPSSPSTSQTTPAPPPPSQNPPNPDVLYPKSTKKLFLTTFAVIFLLILLTTGAALALAYNNYPLIKPPKLISNTLDGLISMSALPKPPRIVLGSVVAKATTLKSADLKTEMSLSTTSKDSPITSFKLALEGPVNFEKNSKRAAEGDISIEVKFEGASFNGTASVKTIENTLFFKINEFPFGSLYQQLLAYKNKWFYYKIPDEYVQEDEELLLNDDIKTILSTFIEKSQSWTKATTDPNGDYLLEVTPPKSDLDQLILDILNSYAKESIEKEKLLESVKLENVSKFTEKLENIKITAIASKNNYYLKKTEISFDITPENISLPTSPESLLPATQTTYNFKLSTELSNYNKQIVIVPPPEAEDIQSVVDSLTKSPYNSMNIENNQSADSQIKSDIGLLATALQAYSATSQDNYPANLEALTETNNLKALPIPPAQTGFIAYPYLKDPTNCDGTEKNKCTEVAIYAPLTQPKAAGNVWCFQSVTGKAQELTQKECIASKAAAEKTGNGITLEELLSPKSRVLGIKSNWELKLLNLFSSFLR